MQVRGLDQQQLEQAATDTGLRLVNFRPQGRGFAFTLGLEGELWRRRAPSGRKVAAVCYHGHAAFMQRVFQLNQDAVLISAQVRYDGRADFVAKACEVGQRMFGQATTYAELCDCTGSLAEAKV